MQQLSLKKLSHCNNGTNKTFFEAKAFFLLESLIALLVVAIMAGTLSMLVSYAAQYHARVNLAYGALEIACSALDAVVYGGGNDPLKNWQQGAYMVSVVRTPNQYTSEAATVRVSWVYQGVPESFELTSIVRARAV